ncbi:hypothetical protein IJ818_00365 [bacterium]|nr:hypothetical protein [bacterium]
MSFIRLIKNKIARRKRIAENCYDNIISLGYNCEVTFRFLKYFGFENTNLFNWTYSYSVNDLINALNNFGDICSAEMKNPDPLWECEKTHLRFHGKADTRIFMKGRETEEILQADKADLLGRVAHLKEKFLNILKDDTKKLYIYKIKKDDIDENVNEKLLKLLAALKNLGGNNFKLLIVAEKENAKYFTENENYMVRFVKYFAPDNCLVRKKYFNNGWDDIYNEFYVQIPDKQENKNKKYKFD